MINNIKVDVEITDENDKMVSNDTELCVDYESLDIDHLSLKQLLTLLKSTDENNIQIVQRLKNLDFIEKYQFTEAFLKKQIKSLNQNDYYDGPLPDLNHNRQHPVWIFKKYVQSIYCYIKIKVINHGRFVIVISFHENEE